jgi:hypothetical protein
METSHAVRMVLRSHRVPSPFDAGSLFIRSGGGLLKPAWGMVAALAVSRRTLESLQLEWQFAVDVQIMLMKPTTLPGLR